MLKCKACVRRAELVSALYWLDAEDPIPGDDPMTMDEVLLVHRGGLVNTARATRQGG